MISLEIRTLFKARARVIVLTGAGVSAESGVPTFRDALTGLWARFKPEELATPRAFAGNPKLVWDWYAWRREMVSSVQPNAGHRALVTLEGMFPRFDLITQNVDGLHQRAGSSDVVELHGNITRTRCIDQCGVVASWTEKGETPPRCPECGGLLRPDVVWFEEPLPEAAINRAVEASTRCDVFLCVGTSGLVYPAAALPFEALKHGATFIEINPERTPISKHAHFVLNGPSGQVLPELVAAIRGS